MVYNIKSILDVTAEAFKKKGIPSARLDAEILLGEILHLSRIELYTHFDQPLTQEETDRYREFVRRRLKREPVAYILGHREFYGREFAVAPPVLVPRPDTETLIETVIAEMKNRDEIGTIIDLGTGSGAIAITLSLELSCDVVAVDISEDALKIATSNAEKLQAEKVKFAQGDLFTAINNSELCAGRPTVFRMSGGHSEGRPTSSLANSSEAQSELSADVSPLSALKFSAVVSNPPYIPTGVIKTLEPEIAKEPVIALDGGADGLDFYRRIVADSRSYLASGGLLAVEVGIEQADAVAEMIKKANQPTPFYDESTIKITADLAGIPRVVSVRAI